MVKGYGVGTARVKDFYKSFSRSFIDQDLASLCRAVTQLNRLADQAAAIPAESGGSQWYGHEKSQAIFVNTEQVIARPLEICGESVSLKDWHRLNSLLRFCGCRLIRKNIVLGHPLPFLALIKTDYSRGITKWLADHKSFHRLQVCPVSNIIVHDDFSNKFFVDMSGYNINTIEPYLFAEKELMINEAYRTSDFATLGILSIKMSNLSLMKILRLYSQLKVLCYGRFLFENGYYFTDLVELLQKDLEDDGFSEISSATCRDGAMLHVEQGLIQLIDGISKICQLDPKGSLFKRSSIDDIVSDVVAGFNIDAIPQSEISGLIEETCTHLLSDLSTGANWDRGTSAMNHIYKPVDLNDLVSVNSFRRHMSLHKASEEFHKLMEEFTARVRKIDPEYRPAMPIPYSHSMLDGVDLARAAVGARIIFDYERYLLKKVPDTTFEFPENLRLKASDVGAYKNIATIFSRIAKKFMSCQLCMREFPATTLMIESLIKYAERTTAYTSCGVHSVHELIVPIFFFSQQWLDRALAGEAPDYRDSWLEIRNIITNSEHAFLLNRMDLIKAVFMDIYKMLIDLSLCEMKTRTKVKTIDNPFAQASDPFMPQDMIMLKSVHVENSKCPVVVTTLPPGCIDEYNEFIRPLAPYINSLRMLESSSVRQSAVLRKYSKFGAQIDNLQLTKYQFSDNIFYSVNHKMEKNTDRTPVLIISDHSGSMGAERAATAGKVCLLLAEGLMNFNVTYVLYTSDNSTLYSLIEVFSEKHEYLGKAKKFLTMMNPKIKAGGFGSNYDGASWLAAVQTYLPPERGSGIVVIVSDHEFLSSLSNFPSIEAEIAYAAGEIAKNHQLIAVRVGEKTEDCISNAVPHRFIHASDGALDKAANEIVKEIYACVDESGLRE